MRLVFSGIGLAVVLALNGVSAHAAEDERLLGYSRAAIEATLPNLPADQLDLLVYRIPTIHQLMARAEPISADAVNPFDNLGLSRVQLAAKFSAMPSSEIDRLAIYLDRIALRNSGK